MVNVNKLKGKIVESNTSIEELAKQMDMAKSTLYRKINSKGETMTIKDVDLIVKILNLSLSEASAIFFSQLVA